MSSARLSLKAFLAGTLCLSAALVLPSCGAHQRSDAPVVLDSESSTAEAPIEAVEVPRTRIGDIARARLIQTLDQGVGMFLTTVEVEAYVIDENFVGWQIQRFGNEWVDILPGDIVTSVNGKRIETPAQVQALWLTLRGADEIVVSATRQGEPFELRFAVLGEVEGNTP